jgi:hypothetical protein
MHQHIIDLTNDADILLRRALLNRTVNAFGADGLGQHGTDDMARQFKITNLAVEANPAPFAQGLLNSRTSGLTGLVSIDLEGYDSTRVGHVFTDKNLAISLNALLQTELIDPACWTWAKLDQQGETSFAIAVDLERLAGF